MTSTDICNGALGALGDYGITDLATDNTPTGKVCRQFYDTTLASLLRRYAWNFAASRGAWNAATATITGASTSGTTLRFATVATSLAVGDRVALTGGLPGPFTITAINAAWFELSGIVAASSPWASFTTGSWSKCPAFGPTYTIPMPADCLRVMEVNGYNSSTKGANYQIEGRSLLMNSAKAQVRFIKLITDPSLWDAHFVEAMHLALASKMALKITQSSTREQEMQDKLRKFMVEQAMASDALENASWVIPDDAEEDDARRFGDGY